MQSFVFRPLFQANLLLIFIPQEPVKFRANWITSCKTSLIQLICDSQKVADWEFDHHPISLAISVGIPSKRS